MMRGAKGLSPMSLKGIMNRRVCPQVCERSVIAGRMGRVGRMGPRMGLGER